MNPSTWTVFNSMHHDQHTTGLSLASAADALLSEDGHRWEVRLQEGRTTLWRTQAGGGGSSPMVQLAPDRYFGSEEEAFLWVVDLDDDWKGLEAMTDEAFARYVSDEGGDDS